MLQRGTLDISFIEAGHWRDTAAPWESSRKLLDQDHILYQGFFGMAVMTPPPSACVYIPYLLHLPLGIPWFSCLTFLEVPLPQERTDQALISSDVLLKHHPEMCQRYLLCHQLMAGSLLT